MVIDFKVEKDQFGYYIVAYRFHGKAEVQYDTCRTIAMTFKLRAEDIREYIHNEYGSEEKPKNDRMHFSDYAAAQKCAEGFRALVPKAIRTNNLFLAT